jgi:hypothetical protein
MTTASVVLDPERGRRSVVLGAVNRGPLQMAETSAALHTNAGWSEQAQAALRAAIGRDLQAAGRTDDICEMRLCEMTILRAIASALVQ